MVFELDIYLVSDWTFVYFVENKTTLTFHLVCYDTISHVPYMHVAVNTACCKAVGVWAKGDVVYLCCVVRPAAEFLRVKIHGLRKILE